LLAPFDSVVTRRLREPGDTVTIGTAILRVADTSRVYVRASIDETALSMLAEDQRGEILFPGGDAAPIPARVTHIAWEADRQTHEIFVELTPDRLDRRVAIGQRADVRIELARRDRALRIPIAAIHHDAIGPYVFVDRSGRIAVTRPRLGIGSGDHVEVLDGLVEGDAILAAPSGGTLPTGRRWEGD
jgi:HlyD family secretion protein